MIPSTFCRTFRLADNAQFLFLLLPEYPYQKHSYVALYMSAGRHQFSMSYLTFDSPEKKIEFLNGLRPNDVQDFYVGFRRSDKFLPNALISAVEAFPDVVEDV